MKSQLNLVVTLALLLGGCSSKKEAGASESATSAAAAAAPLRVTAATAESKTVERYLNVTGSLLPDESVNLAFEVPGRLAAIRYDFGQPVKKGDIVAELDSRDYRLQVDRAQAALTQAMARVGLKPGQDGVTPEETPAIRQARAQLEDAQSKYESARKLVDSGDIARERFTELESVYLTRRAAAEAARDELRMQLAAIEGLRADLRLAEQRLADTVLRAPFDGAISDKPVSPGAYVKDNSTIVTIVKAWPLRLRLDVPEVATMGIRLGDTLHFTTEAVPDVEFTATVRQLNPGLDAHSRSLAAEARLNQVDNRLKPGMFVQVRVTINRQATITVIPKQAVYTVAGLTKVFAIRDNRARELRFTPGQTTGDWVEVPGDLIHPGERVASSDLHLLTDNQEVRFN